MILIVAFAVLIGILLTAGFAVAGLYILGFAFGALWRSRLWRSRPS
jgi:hypothetical protein